MKLDPGECPGGPGRMRLDEVERVRQLAMLRRIGTGGGAVFTGELEPSEASREAYRCMQMGSWCPRYRPRRCRRRVPGAGMCSRVPCLAPGSLAAAVVALCGGHLAVASKLLHGRDVRAGFEQIGDHSAAEVVRAGDSLGAATGQLLAHAAFRLWPRRIAWGGRRSHAGPP